MTMSKDDITESLRGFKRRRDDLLHEDTSTFEHHFSRFLEFCSSDKLVHGVLAPLEENITVDVDAWWANVTGRDANVTFPSNPDEELMMRYRVLQSVAANPRQIYTLGFAHGQRKLDDSIQLFRSLVVRPFAEDLSHRIGAAADLATPEARAVQAVPLNRIPSPRETKIFLSHKSVDKPLVYRYYHALRTTGFDPWLDETHMPAGANLERELLRGFEESCAAVFFITESYKDEKYLATEVEYAIIQKRKKEKKFAIITLRYTNASPVPGLLIPYIYKDVGNDLEGFNALVTALPLELGPPRWKANVI